MALLGTLSHFIEITILYFLLCNSMIFRTTQYPDYMFIATCPNGTRKIKGNSCFLDNGTIKSNCTSDAKLSFVLKKFNGCQITAKHIGNTSQKPNNTGILMPEYKVYRHSRWKRQIIDKDECEHIEPPKPGKVTCRVFNRGRDCVGRCAKGYRFIDGSLLKVHRCFDGGPWVPSNNFPKCQVKEFDLNSAQCTPSCENGGTCIEVNVCSCPDEFRGRYCQYPLSLCGVDKTSSASSWQCNHTKRESVCKISCYAPGTVEASNRYNIHTCTVQGVWNPPLPSCVTSKAISCSDPGGISGGNRTVSHAKDNVFTRGSKIFYFCNGNSHLVGPSIIECLPNGQWSSTKPSCMLNKDVTTEIADSNIDANEVSCPTVIPPKNAEIRMILPDIGSTRTRLILNVNNSEQNESRTYGKTCPVGTQIQYKCSSKFYKLYGSEYQTCQQSGIWSGNKPVCLPECGNGAESPRAPYIVGGQVSEAGMWPWQVALSISSASRLSSITVRHHNTIVCGGSLISEKWVITAAHCVTVPHSKAPVSNNSIVALFGKHYRDSALDAEHVQLRKVRRVVIHDEYDFVKFEADISLLELDEAVELTTRIQPICLPTEASAEHNLRAGQIGVVTGWGLTENGSFSEELRETNLTVVTREECEESYHNGHRSITVSERMICAGGEKADTCSGDSGGPFAFLDQYSSRKWILEGIVSWGSGAGCGRAKEYSGFTKVIRFVEWIKTYL